MNYIYLSPDICNLIYKYQDDTNLYKMNTNVYDKICKFPDTLFFVNIIFQNNKLIDFLSNDKYKAILNNYGSIGIWTTRKEILKFIKCSDVRRILL
jgi:hypothetical protein